MPTLRPHFPAKLLLTLAASLFDLFLVSLRENFLNLPIFLDTIGAITILLFWGLWFALAEHALFYAFFTLRDFLKSGSAYFTALYALAGFAIIASTWLFVRKKEKFCTTVNNTFLFLLTAAVVSSLASVLTAGTVNIVLARLGFAPRADFMLIQTQFSDILGLFLGRLPSTVLDRIIVTFTAWGAYRLIQQIVLYKNGGGY